MTIHNDIKEEILRVAKLDEVISDFITLEKSGKELVGKCPFCHKSGKGKGLKISLSKNVAKCFSCGESIKTAVDYLMKVERKDYPEALKYLADKYNIIIDRYAKKKPEKHFRSFRDDQLAASGLTDDDQKVKIRRDDNTEEEIDIYSKGTIDQYGNFSTVGDDMVIWYIGLDGKPVMYKRNGTGKLEKFWRVRWQNPDNHLDKDGNPVKYQSPYKSGSHLYIPEAIRRAYNEGRKFKRLYIQEGEKKADKACKHGMFSVGIMGIHNIGQNGKLPMELELIVKRCEVKEIVFTIDADWSDLSNNLQVNKRIDNRPHTFFCAVRNFRDYFRTFKNFGIYLELFFAHGKNEKLKGIDDLLKSCDKEKTHEKVLKDIDYAINEKDGQGEFLNIYKITTISDLQLQEYWHIQSAHAFAEFYKDKIIESGLQDFLISKHRWRFNEKGEIELAQPLDNDEIFWIDESYYDKRTEQKKEVFSYDYVNALTFLRNRGFGRIMMASGQYQFCRIENKIVRIVDSYEIKDYVMELAKQICCKGIRIMLLRGGKMYLGPDQLGNLDFWNPEFEIAGRDFQLFFFSDKYWKITADSIEENTMSNLEKYVWSDKVKDFNAAKINESLITVEQISESTINSLPEQHREKIKPFVGKYDIKFSEDGLKCDFLQFLRNASDFYHDKEPDENITDEMRLHKEMEQQFETNMHLLSKLTALGYLLHKYRNKSLEKAVVGMDGKLSEVGESWGRSGKSLLGKAIGYVIPQVIINGKNKNLADDPFWAEEVTEKTDNMFIDDVRANFDFEFLFTSITGSLTVNKKGMQKFTLDDMQTPKIYLTTNHSINGDTPSFRARQMLIAFSDYYNEFHRPEHDFKTNFFTEWNFQQWNLFYNMCANALQLYFKFGLIESPTERLERRRLRQFIGEDFMTWAHEYFGTCDDQPVDEIYNADATNNGHMNHKISRRDMFNDFIDKNPNSRKFITPNKFKKKILSFCNYMGLSFNPHCTDKDNKPGADDKSGGIEYFTIANNKY